MISALLLRNDNILAIYYLMQSLELSLDTEVIRLWPAINTTLLQFYLYATSSNFRVFLLLSKLDAYQVMVIVELAMC